MSVLYYKAGAGPEFLSPRKREIQKVKRQLFGPPDHEETQRFVAEELGKLQQLQSERWNFDFKNERNLSSDGIYDWIPVTPVKFQKCLKRKVEFEADNLNLYCLPEDICRPKPIKLEQNVVKSGKTQSLITDFMQIKKNSTNETTKKLMARPNKIPRLGNELKS